MADVHVTGLAELQRFLDDLPPKLERNIMRGALRAGLKVVRPVAQGNIHSVSGKLAKGLKIGSRAKGGTVMAYLRTTGQHAFVAKFLEFGVKPHTITAKDGILNIGGLFAKSVKHPGFAPKKFMRPALDSQASAAVVAAGTYIRDRLATKEGLDTADIVVEGALE